MSHTHTHQDCNTSTSLLDGSTDAISTGEKILNAIQKGKTDAPQTNSDMPRWQRMLEAHPDLYHDCAKFVEENHVAKMTESPVHDPASQPAFVMMIANCVREVQSASPNTLSLRSIASLVLDAVHAAVRADWVDLAATVQAEQEADDPSIPDELVDTFRH